MANDTSTERDVTTDRDRIEGWAKTHDAVPVRRERGGDEVIELVPESERHSSHEELSWEEFHDEIDRRDMVVVHREEEERRPFSVSRREDLLGQASIDTDEVEEKLVAGETVTATITETTVVEQTIVEEATIESEVVDRTIVESGVVDAELISRDTEGCTVTEVNAPDTLTNDDQLETGHQVEDTVAVEVEVDEGWTVTKEVLERLTIESRIVGTEATETDTVESENVEETVELEGVQEAILESGMLESETETRDVVESGSIESEFREGDVVETSLLERKTIEEEVSLRKQFSGEIGNGTTAASETIRSEAIETSIAHDEDLEAYPVEAASAEGVETATGAPEETPVGEEDAAAIAADEDAEVEATGEAVVPTQADEGKTVVDASGEEVGMVVDVEEDTVYVDPHPSITDRIKQVLDWGGRDEDSYPLRADQIERITADEVELAVEEEGRT